MVTKRQAFKRRLQLSKKKKIIQQHIQRRKIKILVAERIKINKLLRRLKR